MNLPEGWGNGYKDAKGSWQGNGYSWDYAHNYDFGYSWLYQNVYGNVYGNGYGFGSRTWYLDYPYNLISVHG